MNGAVVASNDGSSAMPISVERLGHIFYTLSPLELAECAYVAAKLSMDIWSEYESRVFGTNFGVDLVNCYEHLDDRNENKNDLVQLTREVAAILPVDLASAADLRAAYAGYAIQNIGLIYSGECREIDHSIAYNAVVYSAAAVCASGIEVARYGLDAVGSDEWQVVEKWWNRCANRPRISRYFSSDKSIGHEIGNDVNSVSRNIFRIRLTPPGLVLLGSGIAVKTLPSLLHLWLGRLEMFYFSTIQLSLFTGGLVLCWIGRKEVLGESSQTWAPWLLALGIFIAAVMVLDSMPPIIGVSVR